MQQAFEALLENPGVERYLAARRLASLHMCEQQDIALTRVSHACLEGRFSDAEDLLDELLASLCLSPRAHFLAGWVAQQQGDEQGAELARFCFRSCLEGILSTGEGSLRSPFQVTYRSDVADVLEALGLTSKKRRTTSRSRATYDVVECDDGAEYWFDVSLALAAPPAKRQAFASRDRRPVIREPLSASAKNDVHS